MAKFVMRRLPDEMNAVGGRMYPQMLSTGEVSLDKMARKIADASTFTRGDVCGAVTALVEEMAWQMALGKTVCIEGLGRFRASLQVMRDFEREEEDGSTGRRTGRSVEVGSINFTPDKGLVARTRSAASLERLMPRDRETSPRIETLGERLAAAVDYLGRRHTMSVSAYAYLTGLSRSSAQRELRRLASDPASPLDTQGSRSHTLYILRAPAPASEGGE
ncbi:MAG: DNA-binding protein [Alloprevotella sp.]|nr:DNA-binding protein [Alloprevotella sp.]MBR1594985.1 DNA-binding protein [Alloprevotella sp.]